MPRRRARALVWALGVFGAVALVFGLIVWDAHRRATAVLQQHTNEVAEKIAHIRAGDSHRPSIYCDSLPGNAWELCTKGVDVLGYIHESELPDWKALDPKLKSEPATFEALLAKYESTIEVLRKSQRMEEVVPDYPYEDGGELYLPYSYKAIQAAQLLAWVTWHLHCNGRDAEGAEFLAVAIGVGHDLARRAPLYSRGCMIDVERLALKEWKRVLEEHRLTAGELERFASVLGRLEHARPPMRDTIDVEDATARQALLKGRHRTGDEPGPSWRHLYSRRLLQAEALNETALYFTEMRAVSCLPPHERVTAERKVEQQRWGQNPLSSGYIALDGHPYCEDTEVLVGWALVRSATAVAWYEAEKGAFPARLADLVPRYIAGVPRCPYTGTPLRYDGKGRVWSIGGDGDDDGGKPLADEDDFKSDGDVVWTVKPRGR